MSDVSRRDFILLAGAGVAALPEMAGRPARGRTVTRASSPSPGAYDVFPCSVASGDPSPDGVVLWTRVNPIFWRSGTPLLYEVALDPNFTRPVVAGEAPGHQDAPARDFTYHVRLDGVLAPGGVYYYRFIHGRVRSRTGRCRTLPADGIERVKLAVVTCNDYTNGYYGAFARIAMDATVDFVVHLGDFIYETTGGTEFQRRAFPDRSITLPGGQNVAMGLADYRALYRTYRSDRLLQLAMEYHTWIVIWDDHELADDCYWDYARDTAGAPGHPYQTNPDFRRDAARLRQLKLDSQRAWSEYVPTAAVFDRAAGHPHAALRIFRSFRFGDLLDLHMTDERTYRSPHPCGEEQFGDRYVAPDCLERRAPDRTMLGLAQRDWFVAGIVNSPCLWKGWGNEVLVGPLTIGNREPGGDGQVVVTTDGWDGYLFERQFLLEAFRDAGVTNLVTLTGDLHSCLAAYLKTDYTERANDNPANVVGVEFMTPAVTSANIAELAGREPLARPAAGGVAPDYFLEGAVRTTNPHVLFFDSQDWGYSTVEFTRSHCEFIAISVDKSVNSPFAPTQRFRRIRVPSGVVRMDELPP